MRPTDDEACGDSLNDLLAMLRALQHQLANAMSAVCSHGAIVEHRAAAGNLDSRTTANFSRACDQAMRVTNCVRHLLTAYDRPASVAAGGAVLAQTHDLLHALVSRPVQIELAEDADIDWQTSEEVAFVLIGQWLFDRRETIRQANRLSLTARRESALAAAIELRLAELGERSADDPVDAELLERMQRAGIRVVELRETEATVCLQFILPVRE